MEGNFSFKRKLHSFPKYDGQMQFVTKNITNEQIKIRRFLNFRKIVSSNWFPCYVTVIYIVRIDNLKTENNENGLTVSH